MRIFGREPAVAFALLAVVINSAMPLTSWSGETQSLVQGAVLALAGFGAAAFVSVDAALPALVGLVKATIAVAVGFGLHVPDTTQAAILAIITAIGAFFVRTQVTALVRPGLPKPDETRMAA